MDDFEKYLTKKNAIFCIIIVLLLLIFLIYSSINDISKVKISNKPTLVKEATKFYTVSSCVNKFYSYLNNNDATNLILMLDESYVTDNNINNENICEKMGSSNENTMYNPIKMYEEKIDKNITKYYVYGQTSEEIINSPRQNIQDVYFEVVLFEENFTFSIKPYIGNLFK